MGSARPERGRLGRAKTTYVLAAAFAIAALHGPAPAAADSGGTVLPPPAKQKKQSAPAAPLKRARVADVRCVANPTGPCVESHRAERGGTIELLGRDLAAARQVVFYGAKGPADDAVAPVQSAQAKRAVASVPPKAVAGSIAVIDSAGKRSARWSGLVIDIPQSVSFRPAGAIGSVEVGLSQPRKIFYAGMQKAVFNFKVTGARPLDVQVDLVRMTDGAVLYSWQRPGVAPGSMQRITWNGSIRGRAQAPGQYAFRATTPGAVARAQVLPSDQQDAVTLMGYVFPIKGTHNYGGSGARFGAGRRGHVHQGHDVFARCGTPLVAARGGKVEYAGYHSLAGYYVVIDGKGTGVDYAYMHLREPALVATGATVYTGQQIGEVGDTGDAVGCHLHFEEWSAPGWYKGGHPYDPLPDLKAWDAVT